MQPFPFQKQKWLQLESWVAKEIVRDIDTNNIFFSPSQFAIQWSYTAKPVDEVEMQASGFL